jgi:hypothetical protein
MQNLRSLHRSLQFRRIAQPTQSHIKKLPRTIHIADPAANQKLGHDRRYPSSPPQRSHARRIIIRNPPALGHRASVSAINEKRSASRRG